MVRRRLTAIIVAVALAGAACSSAATDDQAARSASTTTTASATSTSRDTASPDTTSPDTTGSSQASSSTTFLDYRDAITRQLERDAREPRPVENSAMPPRHLNEELFPEILVDRFKIVQGGPPPDGIPSIDDPSFTPATDVDFLADAEAVIVLDLGGTVRIYPVQILIWHEIVNDVVDGRPITVTYCPLCNSAVGFDRRIQVGGDDADEGAVQERVLEFGTSGSVYQSALVMFDRETESLWTHFDGRAVVGTLMGSQLELVPLVTSSWADALDAHPQAEVLDRNSGFDKPYGQNRYSGYDQAERPLRGFFSTEIPEPIPPMSRVVGVRRPDGAATSIPTDLLAETGVVELALGDETVVAFWRAGTNSPLQRADITAGDDIGASGVFEVELDGQPLTFTATADGFVDAETNSTWNLFGHAIEGPLTGARLTPVEHLDTFWFAWVAHHPGTELVTTP